jgi:hypothetical protein
MPSKKPTDLFWSQKLEPEVVRLAEELLKTLQSYDRASGKDNAPQLKVQLLRFAKKMRRSKKIAKKCNTSTTVA